MITNDYIYDKRFDYKIVYKASDILAGDSYSLFETKNGNTLIYVLDAMGHGLLPSLTSFAIASAVKQYILTVTSFEEFADNILHTCQSMLSVSEQLSCAFIYLDKKLNILKYFMAGMYPAILQDFNRTIELKSNNPPIMNFSQRIFIDEIELKYFKKLLIYSDGLVENENEIINYTEIKTLLNPFILERTMDTIRQKELDDDITILYFEDRGALHQHQI
jgi:serine phosphatase RsbU (regulator of sigma subunit)